MRKVDTLPDSTGPGPRAEPPWYACPRCERSRALVVRRQTTGGLALTLLGLVLAALALFVPIPFAEAGLAFGALLCGGGLLRRKPWLTCDGCGFSWRPPFEMDGGLPRELTPETMGANAQAAKRLPFNPWVIGGLLLFLIWIASRSA